MIKSKYRIDIHILIPIILMALISIITIKSATTMLGITDNLMLKQIIWYIIGFIISYLIIYIGNDKIYEHIWSLYIIGILSLLSLLVFANPINNSKCWFIIPGIGTIQPSEFMKIILILTLGVMINKFNNKYKYPSIKQEFIFLFKIGIIVLIPSFLTFLEPDTGVVIIYLVITFTMLFISGIRYRWFIILFTLIASFMIFILILYFINNNLFINIFGTSFFLRIDRLLDWSNKDGYQLTNSLMAIGSSNWLGFGFNNTPIYFPEAQTDFIFSVYASNFGYIGSLFLILIITYFDIELIILAIKSNNYLNKYIISGIIGMLIYQQFQNIGMTFGVVPITGITLPFISYGGSSLLSYMIMAGILFNIANNK